MRSIKFDELKQKADLPAGTSGPVATTSAAPVLVSSSTPPVKAGTPEPKTTHK